MPDLFANEACHAFDDHGLPGIVRSISIAAILSDGSPVRRSKENYDTTNRRITKSECRKYCLDDLDDQPGRDDITDSDTDYITAFEFVE